MVSWVIWENLSVETNHLTVTSKDLPEAFDNFSIAHISDLHNAEYGKNMGKGRGSVRYLSAAINMALQGEPSAPDSFNGAAFKK